MRPFATAIVLSAAAASASAEDRDAQWSFAQRADGRAVATFRSWDNKTVVFTITCDRRTKDIVLQYALDAAGYPVRGKPTLRVGEAAFKTNRRGDHLEGRSRLTRQLRNMLVSMHDVEVDAPNEIGEPWYVGRASPFRKVALACR